MLDSDTHASDTSKTECLALSPQVLSDATCTAFNALAAHDPQVDFAILEQNWHLAWRRDFVGPKNVHFRIDLEIGSHSMSVYSEKAIFDILTTGTKYSVPQWDSEPKTLGLILEYFLANALDVFEDELGQDVSISKLAHVEQEVTPETFICFECNPTEHLGEVIHLFVQDSDVQSLALDMMIALCSKPISDHGSRIPCCASLHSFPFVTSPTELATYKLGDIFLLCDDWLHHDEALLVINERMAVPVMHDGENWHITSGYQNWHLARSNYQMETKYMAEGNRANLDQMPVLITAEFDRAEFSMAELNKLGEGAVIPFQNKTPENVTLFANGKRFANGHLVRVEDRVGIQVDSFAD
ncbi:MAG: FliM/FliN family flagellar motor switch protein [Pseudomonadota bacterium]